MLFSRGRRRPPGQRRVWKVVLCTGLSLRRKWGVDFQRRSLLEMPRNETQSGAWGSQRYRRTGGVKRLLHLKYSKKGRGDVKPGVEKGVEVPDRCDTLDQLAIRWHLLEILLEASDESCLCLQPHLSSGIGLLPSRARSDAQERHPRDLKDRDTSLYTSNAQPPPSIPSGRSVQADLTTTRRSKLAHQPVVRKTGGKVHHPDERSTPRQWLRDWY